jgi:L-asparagine transporter-like permease
LAGLRNSWAAEAGGPKYGRLFGFIVAWWSSTAWTTFCASNSQAAANYVLAEINAFNLDFSTDVGDVKFRAVQWIVAETFLAIAVLMNWLPPRHYKYVFKVATCVIILDWLMNMIWLPIGVAKTYGFQSADFVFTGTYNFSGAPPVWNWYAPFDEFI